MRVDYDGSRCRRKDSEFVLLLVGGRGSRIGC